MFYFRKSTFSIFPFKKLDSGWSGYKRKPPTVICRESHAKYTAVYYNMGGLGRQLQLAFEIFATKIWNQEKEIFSKFILVYYR